MSWDSMDLTPILPLKPFEKRGIDFVGPISPPTRGSHNQYILVAVDYVTKWAEARALREYNAKNVAIFLHENIIVRFGCHIELVLDRGTHFLNETIQSLNSTYYIKHWKSTPDHPCNGQVEWINKIICDVLTKTCNLHRTD